MFRSIRLFLSLLTSNQQKRLFILQILVALMSIVEVAGVASIGPFMALVANIDILIENKILAELYQSSGLTNPYDFIFWSGLGVLLLLTLGALISMYTVWRFSIFAQKTGTEIGDRLFKHYMYQPWLFHASGNSSQLTKRIAAEVERVTANIITPLMQMNARLIMALFMSIAIFLLENKCCFFETKLKFVFP